MNLCKQWTLEELETAVNALEYDLNIKLAETNETPIGARVDGFDHVFFMEGEILIFGEVSKADVLGFMMNMGVASDSFVIVAEGDPLFFSSNVNIPDKQTRPTFRLGHEHLPYGFVGTSTEPGVFQFSSPEISKLQLPPLPQQIDDAFCYYGNSLKGVTWDLLNMAKNDSYKMGINGPGWVVGNTKAEVISAINNGNFPYVAFRENGVITRHYLCDQKNLLDEANRFAGDSSNYRPCPELGNFYSTGPYVGWRLVSDLSSAGKFFQEVTLFDMPMGQLETFDVNPYPQEEYHGGEGVYPVVLVEFLRDVNIYF